MREDDEDIPQDNWQFSGPFDFPRVMSVKGKSSTTTSSAETSCRRTLATPWSRVLTIFKGPIKRHDDELFKVRLGYDLMIELKFIGPWYLKSIKALSTLNIQGAPAKGLTK